MTNEPRYDVILLGRPIAGKDPAAVRSALAALMKVTDDTAQRLLAGRPARVVRDVDHATAEKYRRALVGAGAEASIDAHSAPASAAGTPPPVSPSAPATPSGAANATPSPTTATDPSRGAGPGPRKQATTTRPQPTARRLPVVPLVIGALVVAVVALILVNVLGHSNPPRYQLLEVANDMMGDVLRVHGVMMTSSTYLMLSGRDRDSGDTSGLSGGQFMIAIEESVRQTSGQASLTTTIQKDVDLSKINAAVNESRSTIRRRLGELEDGIDQYSEEYAAAYQELRGLFSSYDKLVDVGLYPSRQPGLADFLGAYDMGRTLITMEYMGVLSTIHELDAGSPSDEEFFTTAHEEALRLSDELRQAIK